MSDRKTILLVEDEAIIAMTEKKALERYGYAILTVDTGEDAVEFVNANPVIDLILMDIDLGKGIDGTEAAGRILACHDIPIVFVSSHSEREIVERTEKITSYGYVVKNSSITVLDASIKMAFKLFDAYEKVKSKAHSDCEHFQFLENIMDNFPGMIFWKDSASIYQGCSKAFAKAAGLQSPKEIIGRSDFDLPWKEHEAESYRKADREVLDRGIPEMHILETQHAAAGSALWMDTSKIPLLDLDGHVYGILGVSLDITERKRIEASLTRSIATAEMFLDVAGEINVSEDFQGNILLLNKSGHEILGYESPKLIGRNFFDTCLPEDLRTDIREYFLRLKEGETDSLEVHENDVVTKSGERKTIRWRNAIIKDEDGIPLGVFSSGEDITERKKAEESLWRSLESLSFVLQASNLGYSDNNLLTGVIERNERWAQMLGYTLQEINDRKIKVKDLIHPQDYARVERTTKEHQEGRTEYYRMKYRLRAKTGEYRWILDCGKIVKRDLEGNPVRACGIHQDITEEIEHGERIEALLSEKELILKEVHHRIKNNMNTISSLLTLQAQSIKDPLAVGSLEDARSRVQSLQLLYDKLYRSVGFRSLSVKDYLPALVHEIIGNFPDGKTVKVVDSIQDFMLDAKELQPVGIIINELLTNTMKYAFKGREGGLIAVSAWKADGLVAICVQDDGNGIPESVSIGNSTGFGLQLVQALTRQLQGTIRIERGNGTRVVLEFTP